MQHLLFSPEPQETYPVALLIKTAALRLDTMKAFYVNPLISMGIPVEDMIGFSLHYEDNNKVSAARCAEYLDQLLPALDSLGCTSLLVADPNYFKKLAGVAKTSAYFGYVMPCKVKGFEHMNVMLCPNHQSIFHNPAMADKITQSLESLAQHYAGTHQEPGTGIIHYEYYPKKIRAIEQFLNSLHAYPALSCDIETFSLKHWKAGIGTVGFAWNQHNGGAFACDYQEDDMAALAETVEGPTYYGRQIENRDVRALLQQFFETYTGTLIFHNMGFDAKVIIYTLWMEHVRDYPGLLRGLDFMTRHGYEDTKIITYLATNSCAGNHLSLKDQAHEFAGNYAESEINDIRRIPLPQLLRYNLIDCLSTWYVHDKHRQTVIDDQQEELYQDLFKDSIKLLLQTELTGMPLNMKKVAQARQKLVQEIRSCQHLFFYSPVVKRFEKELRRIKWQKDFDDRKSKAKNPEKIQPKELSAFDHETFNPNSNPQLQVMLYDVLKLPVLDLTKTKQPATGADTLEKLINHTSDPDVIELIEALNRFFAADKILNTFIKAFEDNSVREGGWHYLFGNFNLGGTVSGRLSSSGPNLQNLPSGGAMGKLIKDCFSAPPGYLFCGADFASLEDRISALTTKDPNKLGVYTRGFDGHSLRAANYFADQLPGLNPDNVEQVNDLKHTHPELRQESKAPTFLLTYGGTYHGMMKNLGWSMEKSKAIEKAYHDMYKVSDDWVAAKIKQACRDGYVTVAFGLRVRTPMLRQTILGTNKTPFAAEAEGRTAGNALGQSYGLLNNRAAIQVQQEALVSDHALDIQPCALIHDAAYYMVKDSLRTVAWLNEHLGNAMAWQELPEIQHDEVHLSGELDIFYPSWKYDCNLPNHASVDEIRVLCGAHLEKLQAKNVA